MPDIAHLLASLLLALLAGSWQPASPAITALDLGQAVQFSATWHPIGQPGNEQDVIVIGADGQVSGGATSSAMSPPKH